MVVTTRLEDTRVIPIFFLVIARESLLTVRDVKSTICCAFHGTKYFSTGGSAGQSNIQTGTEGSRTIIVVFNIVKFTVDVIVTFILSVQVQLLEDPSGQKKTSTIGSCV